MGHPQIVINYPAIAACLVAGMVFDFVWYGPLFGKSWARLMGMDANTKPDKKVMQRALSLQLLGLLLTSYVLAHTSQVWRPSVWGAGVDEVSNCEYGLWAAFFTWVGFYLPQQMAKVAWENRPWKLFFINIGHDFFNLLILAEILSCWR